LLFGSLTKCECHELCLARSGYQVQRECLHFGPFM